jgi:hypothetical protein
MQSLADNETNTAQVKCLYELVAARLTAIADVDNIFGLMDTTESSHAPVLVARAFACLASTFWNGIGANDSGEVVMKLVVLFRTASGKKQPAWSVREAATLGAATLAWKANLAALRRGETISNLIECSKQSLDDRKFWRVR